MKMTSNAGRTISGCGITPPQEVETHSGTDMAPPFKVDNLSGSVAGGPGKLQGSAGAWKRNNGNKVAQRVDCSCGILPDAGLLEFTGAREKNSADSSSHRNEVQKEHHPQDDKS